MTDAMRKRVRAVHAQAAIRRFEYRQRNLAKGTWAKVRHELALAQRAFVLTEDAVATLEAKGREPLDAGLALHPKRRIYRVRSEELDELGLGPSAERRVHLDTVLETTLIALVPFPDGRER